MLKIIHQIAIDRFKTGTNPMVTSTCGMASVMSLAAKATPSLQVAHGRRCRRLQRSRSMGRADAAHHTAPCTTHLGGQCQASRNSCRKGRRLELQQPSQTLAATDPALANDRNLTIHCHGRRCNGRRGGQHDTPLRRPALPCALCPVPCALCPVPCALCTVPCPALPCPALPCPALPCPALALPAPCR